MTDQRIPAEDVPVAIAAYLTEKTPGASGMALAGMQQIAVGWSHETWLFDATWQEGGETRSAGFCLRRDPGNALLRHLSDLGEQYRVLKCLGGTDLATPKVHFYEDVPNVLGAPFLVMEKVPGECPNPWGREGRKYYAEAAERGTLPASFTDALATLHNIDWQEAGLDFLGVPEPGTNQFALREIAKWKQLIELSGHGPEPVLTDLICWLEANAPKTDRLALVHGAYRTGNLLLKDDRVSAVLDWELQVIGDPMYDVAYMLSDLNREGSDLLSNLVPRDMFFERYEAATGLTIDETVCGYYQLLYAMRSAAFWMSASGLYRDGSSNDIRLARTEWSIPVVLERAARDLGY
ncbi:MAG: phosphotransferase family protein [Minwuia sp.]|uniref:phosphotransferase family protein n=1 Tax=Minwuia sp. TaxID=2493630 RepID=UPI003A8483D4